MKAKILTLLLCLWLTSLTGCSTPQPLAVKQTLPALPAYPPKPAITWQARGDLVGLYADDAILLRDWLILEDNWRQSVIEIWSLYAQPQ